MAVKYNGPTTVTGKRIRREPKPGKGLTRGPGRVATIWARRSLDYENMLLKTGQTIQYDSKEDDGYYEKGATKDYTVLSTGDYSGTTNITLNGKTHALSNNCVQDERTGLMWARYVPDGDIGPANDGKLYGIDDTNDEDIFDFKDAANTGTLAGHSDWRVPNIFELTVLAIHTGSTPFIDSTAFPSTPQLHAYSSTTYAAATTRFLTLNFGAGIHSSIDSKTTGTGYCRLVRGG